MPDKLAEARRELYEAAKAVTLVRGPVQTLEAEYLAAKYELDEALMHYRACVQTVSMLANDPLNLAAEQRANNPLGVVVSS